MKLTNAVIREFERDQRDYGTRTALHNLLWQVAAGVLRDLGAKRISTTYRTKRGVAGRWLSDE
jgi:hypothetical protein